MLQPGLILFLIVMGGSLLAAVYFVARWRSERHQIMEKLPESVVPVNLVETDKAVLVAEGRGHLVFANLVARKWFGINGGEPNLELMAQEVQPLDAFLELFGKEGQSSFHVGNRRVEATSHYIPQRGNSQVVVVMREIASASYDKRSLDPVQAMNVVSEITQTISGSLRLDQTLASILNSISSVVAYDAAEITLWDEDLHILRPLGQSGDMEYIDKLNKETDGVYHLDDSFSGWIARYRQVLLVSDVKSRPDLTPKLPDYPFQSFVGLPLTVGDRFIGSLELASRKRSAFDHEDMILLQAVAGQAAIAIENARLFQSQTERVTELSGLQQIAAAATSLTDTRQMFSQLTSRVAGLMNVEMCGILLYDEQQNVLVSQPPFYGVPDAIVSMYKIPLGTNNAATTLFQSSDWWYTNNVRGDDLVRAMSLSTLAEAVGVRTTALVPLSVGTRRFGIVQASNKRDGSGFSENDVRLLAIFASQAAVVVENARLYSEERRRAMELGGLQQISQAIGALRNTSELYSQINERIARLMHVQMCGVLLYDPAEQKLIAQTPFFGVNDELGRYYQINVPPTSAMYALYNESESWMSNDLRADPIVHEGGLDRLAQLLGIRQTIIVPLVVAGKRVGVLQVSNKTDNTEFTEDDARILSIFASQAAVLIDNARLYRRMQQRANEAEGLRRVSEITTSNRPLDETIIRVLTATTELLEVPIAILGLLNDVTGEVVVRPEWTIGLPGLTQPFHIDAYAADFQNSVLNSKRTVAASDIRNASTVLPVYRAMADRFGFDGVIQAPLIIREQGVGELTIASRGEREITADDARLVEAVAFQLAAVVERNKLYSTTDADLRARIQELDALTRVSNELNLSLQMDRLLEVIRHEAQRTTNALGSSVILIKPRERWADLETPEIEQRFGSQVNLQEMAAIEKHAILTEQMVLVRDYESSPDLIAQPSLSRSALAMPIQYAEQITGVLHLYSDQPDFFGRQAQDFVAALGNQAAIAVGNALRHQEQVQQSDLLRERAEQLSQIFELGRNLRTQDDITKVLTLIAEGVRDAVGFKIVLMSVADHEAGRMRRAGQTGLAPERWQEIQKNALTLAQVEQMCQPRYRILNSYFLPSEEANEWRSPELPEVPYPFSDEEHALTTWKPEDALLVPLRNPLGELLGMMSVDAPVSGKRPSTQTIEALEIFANQAAFAVENFNLLRAYQIETEAARRERDRLAQLHLVASEIQRANDVPTRLQVVANGIRSAGWERVAITLRDASYEPLETITAGYTDSETAQYKSNLLSGIVWQQRLADPDFRNYRIGQAYYCRYNDPWVTENKLIFGEKETIQLKPKLGTDGVVRWHPADTLYLPLYGLDRSRLIGIITMDTPADGKAPTETSLRPIELFAAQAASAIENTRLYQETERAAQQEARINEVMEAVASTLEVNEIIRSVAKGLQQMIPFTRMTVSLLNRTQTAFETRRVMLDAHGDTAVVVGEPMPLQDTATGIAQQEGASHLYHLSDPKEVPNFSDLQAWRDAGERTSLLVPLVAAGRVLGTMHLGTEVAEPIGFEAQLPLVTRMANLTAIGIENARLLQETIDRERFSAALSRVGQSVNAMLDMESVLDTVCEESINILNVSGAYIALVDKSELVGVAGRGPGVETLVGSRRKLDQDLTIGGAVIRESQPIFENNMGRAGTMYDTLLPDVQVEAILAVPLLREERAVGVLILIKQTAANYFTPDDIEEAQSFAVQATVAIENARLYEETLGLKSFNEAIVQSIQQGIVVLDRTLNIRTVNSFMRRRYGWDEHAIGQSLFLYRPDYAVFLQNPLVKVLQTGQPDVLYEVRQPDVLGNEYVYNFYLYPLLESGTVNGAVVLVEDITERAMLEADIAVRARQLNVLTEVSGRLTSTLDPDSVIALLMEQVNSILAYDNVTLWLRDGDKLVIRGARGYVDAQMLIGIEAEIEDSELFREIASRGQVLNIPDISKDTRFPPSTEGSARSWLGVSMVSQGKLLGLLVLEKGQTAFYTATMEQLALTFANQAAVALENANLFKRVMHTADENTRLYRETADRAQTLDAQTQRLALLNRVSQALSQSLDIENVFEVTLRELVQVFNMDHGGAYLFEAEQQRGRLIVEYPRGDAPPHGVYLSFQNAAIKHLREQIQPVIVKDTANDPFIAQSPEIGQIIRQHGIFSLLMVPLAVGGQVIGAIELDSSSQPRDFTAEQIEIAQTIGSQAAIAVQNASLFEQSVVRTRELETLFEATQSISMTLDLDSVLRNTAEQMLFALEVDDCTISYYDNVEGRMVIARKVDRTGTNTETGEVPQVAYNLSDFPARQKLIDDKTALVVRHNDDKADPAERNLLAARDMATRILLPMVVREQVIGLMELETADRNRLFSINEIRLARTLASQAAVAIDNARLQRETASKLEELFVINELSAALAASIELEQIVKVVKTQVPSLIKAQSILLALLSEDGTTVSYPFALREKKALQIADHPLSDDEVSFVIKRRMPQYLAGDEIDDVLRNLKIELRITKSKCFLGVPMVVSGEPVGAMILSDEENPRAFDIDDQRVLSTVASQVAVSIQNARLFARTRRFTAELEQAVRERTEELQEERDRIEFLYRITTGITASLDIEQVLTRALEMMGQAIDAEMGQMLTVDTLAGGLVERAIWNMPKPDPDQKLILTENEGLAGWAIQSRQSLFVDDVQRDPRWLRLTEQDDEPRSALVALVETSEDILGVVLLFSRQPKQFDDAKLRLVIAAANQVASAMNNAELYALISEQAERLAAMVRREQVEATKNAAIVESIADGVMVADQTGDIVQFNKAAERVLALPRRDVIGHHISDLAGLYTSSGGNVWLEAVQTWMEDPRSYHSGQDVEVQLTLDNNRFVSVLLSPVTMGDQFLGTVSVFRDITREIEVDRMKSEFVATVSHELRTPMTSIKGYADLLLLGAAGQITDQQQRFLSTIKTNADRLSILVNELLDISRIDRGTVSMRFSPSDVSEIIDTTVTHLKGRISNEKKEMDVVVEVPDDLPQIRADFDKFTQILNNLIDNAFNYTPSDGQIAITAIDEGQTVLISIRDTGIGIAKEKQERIWQRFFRDDEQDLVKATSGTGLGLAIVKEYVNAHRGEIWLESEPGKGTTFYVRVPIFAQTAAKAS